MLGHNMQSKRRLFGLVFYVLLSAGCSLTPVSRLTLSTPTPQITPTLTLAPVPSSTLTPSATASHVPTSTHTVLPSLTPTKTTSPIPPTHTPILTRTIMPSPIPTRTVPPSRILTLTPTLAASLIVTPTTQTFPAGASVAFNLEFGQPSQRGRTLFEVRGLPTGVTIEFLGSAAPYENYLILHTPGSLALWSYTLDVLANAGGSQTVSGRIVLNVTSCAESQSGKFTQMIQSNLVELFTAGKPAIEHGLLVPVQVCGSRPVKHVKVTLESATSEAGTPLTTPPRFYMYRSLVWPAPRSIQAHSWGVNVQKPRIESTGWQLEADVAPGLYLLIFERDRYGPTLEPRAVPASVTYHLEISE